MVGSGQIIKFPVGGLKIKVKRLRMRFRVFATAAAVASVTGAMVDVFVADETVACPRIPAIVGTSNGTLLAFAEGRRDSCSDGSAKSLIMSRSVDNGKSWTAPTVLVGNATAVIGNPMPVFDAHTNQVLVQFITSTGSAVGNGNWQIASTDDGLTWTEPVDLSLFFGEFVGIMPGPGNAIQLKSGRLLFAGHYGPYQFDLSWWSDDYGATYNISAEKLEQMDEIALVELSDGRVMTNIRNQHLDACDCRAVALSSDGGETWGDIYYDPQLPSPVCQASIVSINNTLYFSNPASTGARVNITVRKSLDDGTTWDDGVLIWENVGPGYSCLVGGGIQSSPPQGGILFERYTDDGTDAISFATHDL